jgi:periplasmic protein TonB
MFPNTISNMFADSMLETSWSQRARRSWTTLTSFGLQAVVIGLLLLLPLLKTVGLPSVRRTVSTPISMGRPEPPATPQPRTGSSAPVPSNPTVARFVAPGHIPQTIPKDGGNEIALTGPTGCGDCVPGAAGPSSADGPPNFSLSGTHSVPILAPPTPTHVFRTSTMLEGSLIRKVQPIYPPLARTARIQGPVVLFAVISKSGLIDNMRVVSGHPMLVPAAIGAVKQWQYRPFILNQEPIEVETQITVNFVLGN